MVSIVIPVYNEEEVIYQQLELLVNHAHNLQDLEVLVVDGGSVDQSIVEVHRFQKRHPKLSLRIVESAKGRGRQLHQGAIESKGEILYFLHADSYPPVNYDQEIRNAVAVGENAGCFRMRFRSQHWWLVFIGWFTRFDWKASRGGDQSQYITRKLYQEIGGYNVDVPIYEDYLLINKLYEIKTYHVIPKWLTTSARRYEEIGVFKLQWFYLTIYWKKRQGASIEEIYDYYKKWCESSTPVAAVSNS